MAADVWAARFSVDVQMFTNTFESPFPVNYLKRFYTGADPSQTWDQKSNTWSGTSFMMWKNEQFDKLFDQVLVDLPPEKAITIWHQVNDIAIGEYVDIPLVDRKITAARAKGLTDPNLRAFDNETWNIGEWKKA